MKKTKSILPVVLISFQDHSAHLEGVAEAYQFLAVGVILKEDKSGYTLGHWLQKTPEVDLELMGDVTTYIAKVKGLKIQTIAHVRVK